MAGVRDHTDLEVWKLASAVRAEVHRLTGRPAFRSNPGLRQQLRRAAESACANIAEGFARYRPGDFARFLRMANGSLTETLEHLSVSVTLGLLTVEEAARIATYARRARGASTRLIKYLTTAKAPGL